MKIYVEPITSWQHVLRAARATVPKNKQSPQWIGELGEIRLPVKKVTEEFKHNMLRSEHSPLRHYWLWIEMRDIPYWVSVHLRTHHVGCYNPDGEEHCVTSSRSDRAGIPRGKLPQDEPVNHCISINAQALLNISRRRLCGSASPETVEVWKAVRAAIKKIDPALAQCMVPMCLYRGGKCNEPECCGLVGDVVPV